MRKPMSNAFMMSVLGASLLAMAGTFFGVVTARMVWADDLKHARRIDEIRSRTEASLRSRIETQEGIEAFLRSRIATQDKMIEQLQRR
jgi:hypothetical protein